MDEATRRVVRGRAGQRCEYCLISANDSLLPLQIEHIVARKHGGGDEIENLALACDRCNLHKGPNLTGVDPDSGRVTPLFNPRVQAWDDHFRYRGAWIMGSTDIGRTTVYVLRMNEETRLQLRTTCGYGDGHDPVG